MGLKSTLAGLCCQRLTTYIGVLPYREVSTVKLLVLLLTDQRLVCVFKICNQTH